MFGRASTRNRCAPCKGCGRQRGRVLQLRQEPSCPTEDNYLVDGRSRIVCIVCTYEKNEDKNKSNRNHVPFLSSQWAVWAAENGIMGTDLRGREGLVRFRGKETMCKEDDAGLIDVWFRKEATRGDDITGRT